MGLLDQIYRHCHSLQQCSPPLLLPRTRMPVESLPQLSPANTDLISTSTTAQPQEWTGRWKAPVLAQEFSHLLQFITALPLVPQHHSPNMHSTYTALLAINRYSTSYISPSAFINRAHLPLYVPYQHICTRLVYKILCLCLLEFRKITKMSHCMK